jgi:hypothetical protein
LEERRLNDRILLKCISKKCHSRMWTGLIWLKTEASGGLGFPKIINNYKTSTNADRRTVRGRCGTRTPVCCCQLGVLLLQ